MEVVLQLSELEESMVTKMNGSSGLLEIGISGLAFVIAVTSAINVHKTLKVK